MKICTIGVGYVGLIASVGFATLGHDVISVDCDEEKIKNLKLGIAPIYEPELPGYIQKCLKSGKLSFTTNLKKAVQDSDICFITVGTPQDKDGNCNLSYVYDVAKSIGQAMNGYKVVVSKSTVPAGVNEKIQEIIKEETNFEFDIVSNPEFLRQGSAINDFLKPDRIVVGTDSKKAEDIIREVYKPLIDANYPFFVMDFKSAEMTKYASNAFLALKISFINQIANLCETLGADAQKVRLGLGADKRIGDKFLSHGLGYGGSCFPKDVLALIKMAKENNCGCDLFEAVHSINKFQRKRFVEKIEKYFKNIQGKRFAVWGLSFKPNTNDMREAPSIDIINSLLAGGATVCAYDPEATLTAKEIFKDKIQYAQTKEEATLGADALLILTEWDEFKTPDFDSLKESLKTPIIFDGRNQFSVSSLKDKGFEYFPTSRKV